MANYVTAARTNYFHAKDMEAFAAGLPADADRFNNTLKNHQT